MEVAILGAVAVVIKRSKFFVGTRQQVTNQWVQGFLLFAAFSLLIRLGYGSLGIRNEGWGILAYMAKTGLSFGLALWLIRGRLGEILNGPRLAESSLEPHRESEPLHLYYYPSGGNLPLEKAPKRQPIRQPEED